MNQGDIYLVNLDPAIHTETGRTRPGMIISIDSMNKYSPRLIIAPITSNVGKLYPFEISLARGSGGLNKDSKIMLDQIRCLDKHRLIKKIGAVDIDTLSKACRIAQKLISVH